MKNDTTLQVDRLLAAYEKPAPVDSDGRLLRRLIGVSQLVFLGLGLMLLLIDAPPVSQLRQELAYAVTFRMDLNDIPSVTETPLSVDPESEPQPEPEPEIPELTPETQLAQAVDLPDLTPADPHQNQPVVDEPAAPQVEVRRVYGVRKVFARGLGTGAGSNTALVVKRGNTLDGVADTLTATADDPRGQLAPMSTVERAPEPIHRAKPRYSEALVQAQASGVVTARMLIDSDGSVAAVQITKDIGFDSAEIAREALEKFRFHPAQRHGQPVAVWIIHRIRFEFQE